MYRLKELAKKRPVFGMTIYTGSPVAVEVAAAFGMDYLFIDAEHTPLEVTDLRSLVLTAEHLGISALIRVAHTDEVEIRKALEMGAEGVIIPHVRTKAEMEYCVRGAKFPPLGRRGYDSTVHAAHYGVGDFNSSAYIEESNANQLVMPMAEDFEFMENIDEIISVPGVSAVSFGPSDFALSKNIRKFYKLDEPEVDAALTEILTKCAAKDIDVMVPCLPPTYENAKNLVERGARMLTIGHDVMYMARTVESLKHDVMDKFK